MKLEKIDVMKQKKNKVNTNFFRKVFVKISRAFGFELIDQSEFYVPTQKKSLDENLNIAGKKSITIPLGETKVTRKVKALTVIFRSCTSINMLTQNKKRLFDNEKSEYTFRSLNSIITSLNNAKKNLSQIEINIIIIDHNSKKEDLNKIKNQLNKSNLKNSIISLNVDEFKPNIKKKNEKNETVTENQISNMSNIHKSFLLAKELCNDLIYFVEDDYIHQNDAIEEMILSYERFSSQLQRELILCPTDYPYLYTKMETTNVLLGFNKHWRVIDETLCTFLTSADLLKRHWSKFISMCEFEHYPFEKPLHEIYKIEYCLSPIPSLALHCTNVNSIFGISPNMSWKKIWDQNKDY